MLTFFSSLGQTFLISLYVPHILAEMGLTNSTFGTMYAVATIASSLLLMSFGGRIDHRPLKLYLYKSIAALAMASLALGLVYHPLLLPVALLGIRFSGQGLFSHISQTVMGRYFEDDRGKAISLSSLGYSMGEMVFPILITALIPVVGWRISLILNALVLLIIFIPALRFLPIHELDTQHHVQSTGSKVKTGAQWGILREKRFWSIAPAVVLLSFTYTGVLFYQLILAEARGWSPEWYGLVFSGYAATRFAFSLLGGPLVDRYSARKLFPFYLLPLILGLIVLCLVPMHWAGVFFLLCAGISIGSSSPIKSAVIAELYGTNNLGGVRSVYTAMMVFGTALGPMVFGWFLDAGTGFAPILLASAILLAATSAASYLLLNNEKTLLAKAA